MGILSRIKRQVSPPPIIRDPVEQGINALMYNMLMSEVTRVMKSAEDKRMMQLCYIDDSLKRLRQMTRRGSSVIIRGKPGTGKTNLALLFIEANKDRCVWASNNPGIPGTFINNWNDLSKWLDEETDKIKIFIFDDVSDIFSARRSMRKEHEPLRQFLIVECRKKGAFFVAIEHHEGTVDIDVRRAATWMLDKPWDWVPGDQTDGVPLEQIKTVYGYRHGAFVWWADTLPETEIEFDTMLRGEWDIKGQTRGTTEPVEIPKAEGRSFEEYAVDRAKIEFGSETGEILEDWFKGMIQDEIGAKYGYGQSWVAKKLKKVTAEAIGYWFEDYWCEEQGIESNPLKNIPKSDAVIEGVPHSLKCICTLRNTTSFLAEDECKPEMEEAEDHYVIVAYNPLKKVMIKEKVPKSAYRIILRWNEGILEYK